VERELLLTTKLHVPRPRAAYVSRPRLAAHLDEGAAHELVVVSAPPGFGKTTVLADWARHRGHSVAWVSLDDGDNDPIRFWRHVTAALNAASSGTVGSVAALLGPPPPTSLDGVVTALVNRLADSPEQVVLVLDDYHLVEAAPVHRSVGFLLDHLPPTLRVVLAGRADPPLPLARLRGRGQLSELRATDLRFTLAEAAELIPAVSGIDVPDATVAMLEDRTEGWVTGLLLAALSLRGRTDAAGALAEFSGSHRFVLDYFVEEVLDRQDDDLRAFLLETSVLDRLSGPLCDAVTGRCDGQTLLEAAERAGLFLVPLDEDRRWWRYHHLFADLLRARLAQERPGRAAELHRAAAAWWERHGVVDDAVRHGLATGDVARVARLVEQHFEAKLSRSEDATLRRWLAALPADDVAARPRLLLARAYWALFGGRPDEVEQLLDEVERTVAMGVDEPYEPPIGRALSMLANVPAASLRMRAAVAELRGDAELTVDLAHRALAALDEDDRLQRSILRWYLDMAQWLLGRPAEAERGFASRMGDVAEWRAAGFRTLPAWGYHYLGRAQRAQGHLSAASATYRETLELMSDLGGTVWPAAGIACVGMAEVHYERAELDAALDEAVTGVTLTRQLGWTLPLVAGLAVLARVKQARGDGAGARAAAREAEQVQLGRGVVGLLNPVPLLQVRLALARGDVLDPARWAHAHGLALDDEPAYSREAEHLVLARMLLASGSAEPAHTLLKRWLTPAIQQGRMESVIEIYTLLALAHAERGDGAAALTALAEALSLGADEGYLQVVVDGGAPMAALVRRLLDNRRRQPVSAGDTVPRDHLARLVAAFEQAGLPVVPSPRGAVAVSGLIDQLSNREREVLLLLAAGLPNRAIAQELVITLDTVKRHVSHVLEKLGAANRTEAVARARELSLLP
jgi:LuxR family transcriptional regulator, maltose regulon positive regulatory protein